MTTIDWSDSPPFGRRKSLVHTLELLNERRRDGVVYTTIPPKTYAAPLIVELGTSEAYSPDGLGNAMLAFAWYAGKYGARVKSVDIRTVENCREILRRFIPQYADIPEMTKADVFDWATELHEPVDLMYMDVGFELASEIEYGAFARRFADRIPSFYIELYKRFDPSIFQPGTLMLFDDTDPDTFHGKGMWLIPELLSSGEWRRVALRGEPVFPMVLLERV